MLYAALPVTAWKLCTAIVPDSTVFVLIGSGESVSFGAIRESLVSKSLTITERQIGGNSVIHNKMRPIHPGEILREEYVLPLGLSASRLAMDLRVPVTRISKILNEERAVTPDTALRLARYFGGDAQTWLNIQATYDLKKAIDNHGSEIEKDVRPRAHEAA